MKRTTVWIVLLVLTPGALAGDGSRGGESCRELVAFVRPTLGEQGEDGERYLENADKAYRDCRGAKVPVDIRAKALFKYGIASASRERVQAALVALREAIGLLDRASDDHGEFLIEVLDYTASVESRAGMRTDAIAHAKRAAEMRAETYGSRSAEASEGMVHLAMVYVTFKDYAKAEALLREAVRIAAQACGPECDALVAAYAGMETLYEALGDKTEARKYGELGVNAVPANRTKD